MSSLRQDDPRQLGRYRLSERLGQGGQGVVFLGHTPEDTQVAVKLLHANLSGDPEVRRRFLGEVEAVRRVAPFCTAQVLDASLDGDRPYVVSEYVEGPSLREHVIGKGPRRGGSLDRLAIGTATALGAIHRAGVIHRDFKPGNVLLSLDGPRVIDFGISRLMDTAASTTKIPVGTPAYLAPERIKGEPSGAPADLFAWALTVAYTATGRHAYSAETYQEVLARILYGKPELTGVEGPLREIVDACLDQDPAGRPDAEEVLARLLGVRDTGDDVLSSGARIATAVTDPGYATVDLRSGDAATVPDPVAAPVAKRRRVRWWQVAVAVLGLAMGVAGFVLWLQDSQRPPPQRGMTGTWTGTAQHPTARRIFPVEVRIAAVGESSMRWGSDLHCQGRLRPGGEDLVFALDQVKGDQCYPGTVTLTRSTDPNQVDIKVVRQGEKDVTYAGKVSRPS
ncbi:MAG: serine/threonine protein kinase [Nonomuraea sp.]|nr:serine/threonine protein kinase [Nonomuraea sp.]